MPGIHRHKDLRYCGARTVVTKQSTVYVNNELVAVEDDECNHTFNAEPGDGNDSKPPLEGGPLKPVYGAKNIYVENKLVICAAGDEAKTVDKKGHPKLLTSPKGRSSDVIIYGGGAGGGS